MRGAKGIKKLSTVEEKAKLRQTTHEHLVEVLTREDLFRPRNREGYACLPKIHQHFQLLADDKNNVGLHQHMRKFIKKCEKKVKNNQA